ncbi:MAG: carbon storage regulator [Candidatus Saccharimonas sp.]|nr:carbon storage regulator [Planctomycetaceae bacterium]
MLVLTRKIEQSIAVGGATGFERLLKITVLAIGNGNVRLGFEVDASVPIHRWEVWQRILTESQREKPAEDLGALSAQ